MSLEAKHRYTPKTPLGNVNDDIDQLLAAVNAGVVAGGVAGGQTVNGGTAAGQSLTLSSTVHATKGKIFFGALSAYDESAGYLGLGTTSPGATLHAYAAATSDVFASFGPDPVSGPAFTIGHSGASFGRGSAFFNTRPDASAVGDNPSLRFLTVNVERLRLTKDGNIGVNGASFGSGAKVLFLGDASTVPTANPTAGVLLYSESGGLKARSSGGTVTSLSAVYSGTYTPTLTNGTNVSSSTASECQYIRVGNVVTVSGKVVVGTSAAAGTALGISLPIASALSASQQLAGVATAGGADTGPISGDATNDRASLNWAASSSGSFTLYFSFTYQIL